MNDNLVVMILGSAQDGGYPHIGCRKKCCEPAWSNPFKKRFVASLAIIDKASDDCWIIDASPDIKYQINMISDFLGINKAPKIKGIFLTHAHTGHYSGLLELGKESLNASNIPIYVMPEMSDFIQLNKAFNFLIESENIFLKVIQEDHPIKLKNDSLISPFLVPHRNEMSETVGYKIQSNKKSVIYLPDIDSWEDWDNDIITLVKNNNHLFIDGTFYSKNEIQDRNILNIPHPPIAETVQKLLTLDVKEKNKIFFTHLNHSNVIIHENRSETIDLINEGYGVAFDGQTINI